MKNAKKVLVFVLVMGVAAVCVSAWAAEQTSKTAPVQTPKIDINKASIEDLAELKGIGQQYAARIVQYREQHGPFAKVEDIQKVQGIGPKTLEAIKDSLSVK
jgi:competence protein ComEA